jgi:RimJ/RimL family protein N-acetyltransferase
MGLQCVRVRAPEIRRALPGDAAAIVGVLETVVADRIHTAIDQAWSIDQEKRYLESLSAREAVHVAVDSAEGIVGVQTLDRWSPILSSMNHVGQIGTFLIPAWRGLGIGRKLWTATEAFAREAGYRKFAIQVRASNHQAQKFYRQLGFQECGRFRNQVVMDGLEDDEILMEYFL